MIVLIKALTLNCSNIFSLCIKISRIFKPWIWVKHTHAHTHYLVAHTQVTYKLNCFNFSLAMYFMPTNIFPHPCPFSLSPFFLFTNSRLPSWIRSLIPRVFYITEKAWNYFPYTITGIGFWKWKNKTNIF